MGSWMGGRRLDARSGPARLEVTGREATGQSTKGLISLVQEDGAWKVDEEAWATERPRP